MTEREIIARFICGEMIEHPDQTALLGRIASRIASGVYPGASPPLSEEAKGLIRSKWVRRFIEGPAGTGGAVAREIADFLERIAS